MAPLPATALPPGRLGDQEEIFVDRDLRLILAGGVPLTLTYLEFELLAFLVANPMRVFSRAQLLDAVWGYDHVGDGRTVDVHVARLRRKLGAAQRDTIVTVRRVGYKYQPRRLAQTLHPDRREPRERVHPHPVRARVP